jgi:hypothetical protein
MDDALWNISDEKCHELWHYLSIHHHRSTCPFNSKHGKLALETLTISVGSVEDGFQPATVSAGVNGKTWIIRNVDSKEYCISLTCPELDAAKKYFQEDASHSDYYKDQLSLLERFAKDVFQEQNQPVQEAHALVLPTLDISKRQLLMARQVAEATASQRGLHRNPI